jgi:hypothetical protein
MKFPEKMIRILKSSPFGSGAIAANLIDRLNRDENKMNEFTSIVNNGTLVEFLNPETGKYEMDTGIVVSIVEDIDGDFSVSDSIGLEGEQIAHSPTWQREESISVIVNPDSGEYEIPLGCGAHSAFYKFDESGNLIDVDPDEIPSDSFWGDGKKVDKEKRRGYLLSLHKD